MDRITAELDQGPRRIITQLDRAENTFDATSDSEFRSKMRDHFLYRLEQKWGCEFPGHTVCVPTVDGGHHQLPEENLMVWVEALCRGEATTSQPPDGVLSIESSANRREGPPLRAASIAPSRRHDVRLSMLGASASVHQRFESTADSSSSSAAYGPGYRAGKAIEWLGQKTLEAVENVWLQTNVWQYQRYLRQCTEESSNMTKRKTEGFYKALEIAVEMIRPYSPQANRHSWIICKTIDGYFNILSNKKPLSPNNQQMHLQARICHVISVLKYHTNMDDLAHELLDIITKTPLSLQDSGTFSAVLGAIIKELAYAQWMWLHPTLGRLAVWLSNFLLDMWPQTHIEMRHIYQMKNRRLQYEDLDAKFHCCWEIELFVIFEARDPSLRDIALGPHGIPSLMSAMDSLLHNELTPDHWWTLENYVWTFEAILEVKWVTDTVDSELISIFLKFLRRSTSEKRDSVSFAIISSIKNMVTLCPITLGSLIVTKDTLWVFEEFLASSSRLRIYSNPPTNEKAITDARNLTVQMWRVVWSNEEATSTFAKVSEDIQLLGEDYVHGTNKQSSLTPPTGVSEQTDLIHNEYVDMLEDLDRGTNPVKILLLGQSESGKSTVVKNFQRKYDPSAFDRERAAWRAACHLDLMHSFDLILNALGAAFATQDNSSHNTAKRRTTTARRRLTERLTPMHRLLVRRLEPLRQIEHALTREFSPATSALTQGSELIVNGWAWQPVRDGNGSPENGDGEPSSVLDVYCEDMITLWGDPVVRDLLHAVGLGFDELGNYFLDDIERIAAPRYEPTNEDIFHVRLKTIGVTEHLFRLAPETKEPKPRVSTVRMYDVCGKRDQRHIWPSLFDRVDTIMFFVPLSAFNQTLREAPEVNRLQDTIFLWENICSSPLLAGVSLVLLLNKRDLLQRKLEDGMRFTQYVTSYKGDNTWEDVTRYIKAKFLAVHRNRSPKSRVYYCHVTCFTDSTQTSMLLNSVNDMTFRRFLTTSGLL